MSKVLKIAVLAAMMATLNGRAYAAPINIDFNNGTFSNWTVVVGNPGCIVDVSCGSARVVNTAPSRRDVNAHNLDEVGDPADWFSPLTQANPPCFAVVPASGRSCFAFLEAGPIPGTNNGASPNVYTSITSNTFVADPFATLKLWAFFDALDQVNNAWNDDGYARVFNVTTNSYVGPLYAQSDSTMLCNQGSDASRWPHNSFPYLPSNCVQPFAGAMTYALVAGQSYRVEAGVRNGNPADNDNSLPAALGLEAQYVIDAPPQVPEPGTLVLLGSGLGVALAAYRRRSKA